MQVERKNLQGAIRSNSQVLELSPASSFVPWGFLSMPKEWTFPSRKRTNKQKSQEPIDGTVDDLVSHGHTITLLCFPFDSNTAVSWDFSYSALQPFPLRASPPPIDLVTPRNKRAHISFVLDSPLSFPFFCSLLSNLFLYLNSSPHLE